MSTPSSRIREAAEKYFDGFKHVPMERWPALLYAGECEYVGRDHDVFCVRLSELALKHAQKLALEMPEVVAMRNALDNAEDVLRIIYHTTIEGDTAMKARECAAKAADIGAAFDKLKGEM